MEHYDLLIRNGTLIDPAQGIHAQRDVAFSGGVVAAVAPTIAASSATNVIDAAGQLVTPGMIDLHVHVFEGVSHYGIAPDPHCLAHGATTVVDAGSAGADTFPGFRKYVIEVSATRIYAQLNISSMGMISQEIGELSDLKWANVSRALEVIEKNRDLILGVKVRLSRGMCIGDNDDLTALYRAREAADAAGLPIMVHPQDSPCDSIDDILAVMGDRDIVTHCFHDQSQGILDDQGKIRPAVRAARERGVIFDVGHGRGSFIWRICQAALDQDFAPTTISSDLHAHNLHGPVFDLATTITKFLHLGMPLDNAIERVTAVPARVIRQVGKAGTLALGAWGDAVIFDLEEGSFELPDSHGDVQIANQRLAPRRVIKDGKVVPGSGA